MPINKTNPVNVVDPDLSKRTLVAAWDQGEDKKTGDRLVVLESEPHAIRRVKPENVFSARGPQAAPRV